MTGAVKLNTAGGGSVVVQSASSIASDVTVNVPSQNCTLGIQGPAFSASQNSGQSLSAAVWTKINLQVEQFDTNSCFASSRFTPTVAGYYQFSGSVGLNGTANQEILPALYKNGSAYFFGTNPTTSSYQSSVSGLLYCNGTTDYVELYGFFAAGGNTSALQERTYLTGVLVRAA